MKRTVLAIVLLSLMAGASLWFSIKRPPRHSVSITQDAYIWQRDWNASVKAAATEQRSQFHQFVVLAAEVSPQANPVKTVEVRPNYASLLQANPKIGLAIRVGFMASSVVFDSRSAQTKAVIKAAKNAIANASAAGLSVTELQIDFDCPELELGLYHSWVEVIKPAVAPTPVVITALPSWLRHPEFADLARSAGSFVMQVHSLHKPTSPDAKLTICDPAEAERAVELSSKIGVPFRVALPTYSYLAAFNADGKFLALSAEGPLVNWPADAILRPMRSNPGDIAPLVAKWTAHPPANMTGIIWYRLPVAGDAMNWSPVTLRAVMAGRVPRENLTAEIEHPKPGLVDVYLHNSGDADAMDREAVVVDSDAMISVCEGINGFDRLDQPAGGVTFSDGSSAGRRIAPGERLQVGWLRLDSDREVHAHVIAASP
jgi:hypothetical protein